MSIFFYVYVKYFILFYFYQTIFKQIQTKKAANEIKILRSELRLSAEEMKTNGTSLEGLQKQYRLLENETKQYETKLDAINTQIEKATEIYGENSDEVARLKTNYNNTATTLEKVKQQLAATEKAMDEQRSSMQQVDDAVQDTRNSYEKLEGIIELVYIVLQSVVKPGITGFFKIDLHIKCYIYLS